MYSSVFLSSSNNSFENIPITFSTLWHSSYISLYISIYSGYASIRLHICSGESDERNVSHASSLLFMLSFCFISSKMSSATSIYSCNKFNSSSVSNFCFDICIYVSSHALNSFGLFSKNIIVYTFPISLYVNFFFFVSRIRLYCLNSISAE